VQDDAEVLNDLLNYTYPLKLGEPVFPNHKVKAMSEWYSKARKTLEARLSKSKSPMKRSF